MEPHAPSVCFYKDKEIFMTDPTPTHIPEDQRFGKRGKNQGDNGIKDARADADYPEDTDRQYGAGEKKAK
jgi:hypothetical protein